MSKIEEEVEWVWRMANADESLGFLGVALSVMPVLYRHVCKPRASNKESWSARLSVLAGFVYGSAVGALHDPVGEKLSPDQVVILVTIAICPICMLGMNEPLWREEATIRNLIRLTEDALASEKESLHVRSALQVILERLRTREDEA